MKKIIVYLALLIASLAHATSLPVQLLNPASSTAGQAVVSNGPASAPGWANVPLASIATGNVLANVSGSAAAPVATTPSGLFNAICSSTVGQAWVRLTGGFGCTALGYANPVWWGADPTGAANSASAITSALAASNYVLFPPGNFLANSNIAYAITTTNTGITFQGSGSNVTTLTFPTGVNGITITTKDYSSSVHIRGLTLATQGVGTSTGLTITQGASSISNEANTAQSDITDVTFIGATGYSTASTEYWNVGTSVFAVSNIAYISDYWGGAIGAGTGLGTGVSISGTSSTLASVVHNFVGCNFLFQNVGLSMGLWAQGVSVTATNFEEDNQGIVVPSSASAGVVQLAVGNSQFSTYSNDISVAGVLTNASITNNLFYVGGSNSGVVINNASATDYNISNNQFLPGFSPASPNGVAVLAAGAGSNIITGDIFNSLGTGISLSSSANGWGIGENSFAGNSVNFSNTSTSYVLKNGANVSGNGCGAGLAAATTYYLGMCLATTTESSTWMIASQPLTAGNLSIKLTSAPGGSITTTATLRVNGASTGVTCTITGSASACADTTHIVGLALGNEYDVQIATGSGAATTAASWSLTLAP
ncbi:hypothetical protein P3T24_004409 [Paraburkholderia sp. GAS33]|uniref:beta strand repeat-containing protein n=1 Tax=Paraburkholderia sp. GAS33 TaxID=3035130 RepID=UPI003D2480B4